MDVYFKPISNEGLDGDRTITLSHKVATGTGRFESLDGTMLKSSVSVTLTDNDQGRLELVAASKEFNEGSSLSLQLSLSDAPPSGDKITVTLAKGSQDEGVAVSRSNVVFCCLATKPETLIPCTEDSGTQQKNCCICDKVNDDDADITGYLWSYKVPVAYSSTEDDGIAAADKTVSLTATAASAFEGYNGVTTTVSGITVRDIHSAGVRLLPADLKLTEAGTGSKVTIELTSKPNAAVTLKFEDSAAATSTSLLSFSPSTVTFKATGTDWKTPKEVTVTYPRDYTVGEVTKYINVKELGTTVDTTGYGKNTNGDVFLREELVTVTVTDIDTAGFVLTPSAGTISEDGGIFSYAVKLNTIPNSNVVVKPQLPNSKGSLTITPSEITLTPATARTNAETFTVQSTQKDNIDVDEYDPYTIKHLAITSDTDYSVTSLLSTKTPKATVTVTDADTAGFTFSKSVAATENVAVDTLKESGVENSYEYYLRLKTKPVAAVTFTVAEDCAEPDEDVSSSFNNCGVFSIKLNDVEATEHTFVADTDHVTTETALKVTLTIAAYNIGETTSHPPPRNSNLKISVKSGDAKYTPLPSHTLALTIKNSKYVDEIQETIDTQAAENEVTEIKTESGVEVRIPAKAIPKEILDKSDVKIDISTANSAIDDAANESNIKEIQDETKFQLKTSIVEYKITSEGGNVESVSFSEPVEITIPLDSSDCVTEGVYCQCMRAESTDANSEWEILDGIQKTVSDDTNEVTASCFTTSFSLYTVAAVVPTVTIDAYGSTNAITFSEEASKDTLTPITIADSLTVSGTGVTLVSISAQIATNYYSRQDYLTIKCTTAGGDDNWAPAYDEVTSETTFRTCGSGVHIGTTRSADLKANFEISTGILTISGVDADDTISKADAQKLFRIIQYVNSERNPSYGTQHIRDVTFTVSEQYTGYTTTNKDGTDRHAITVEGYNNAPVIKTSTSDNIYKERANAKNVAQLLTIADDDSTHISSAEVTISPGSIDGDYLSYSGVTLSTAIQGTIQDGKITFTGVDTIANYQQALRAITFESTSYNPTILSRTITFKVTDVPSTGLSARSTSADRDLTIEVVNDPPEILGLSLNTNGQFVQVQKILVDEDSAQVSGYQVRVDDKDSAADDITYQISCVANLGTVDLNASTGAISYTPSENMYGEDTFFAIAKDNTGQSSVPFQFSININPIADNPKVTADIKTYNFRVEWEPRVFDFPITHPDASTNEAFETMISFIRLDGGAPVGTLTFNDESVSALGVKQGKCGMNDQGKCTFTYSISQDDYNQRVVNADGTKDSSYTDTFSYIVVDTNQRTARGTINIVVKSDEDEASTPPVVWTTSTTFNIAYRVQDSIAYSGVFYASDSQTLTEDLDFEAGPLPFFGSVATPISSVSCEEVTSPLKAGSPIACPCNQYEDCGLFVYTPNALYYGYDSFELSATDTNGDVSQSKAKIYVYIEPVNNQPTLACEAPRTTADVLISGTSDSLRGLSEFTSSHPLCTTPIIVGKAALDSLEDVRQDTRVVLTCADGFVPASLSGPDGFFAKLLTLLNSFETRAAGEIPLMLATGKTHDWDIPMGGATERASMDICAGLGNDKTSCVADDGCQWLGTSGECVSASWGSPDHVVEVAIALVSYDMDEESGFEARVSGAPDFPSKSGGFLSEPELLAPLFNDAEIDTDVRIFVANTDG